MRDGPRHLDRTATGGTVRLIRREEDCARTPAAPASSAKPLAQHALRAGVVVVLGAALLLGAAPGYLRWHEDELIFVTALSHNRTLGTLPANAERIDIPEAAGTALAAILVQSPAAGASGYWVLHLHGNADTALSPGQIRHLERVAAQGSTCWGWTTAAMG